MKSCVCSFALYEPQVSVASKQFNPLSYQTTSSGSVCKMHRETVSPKVVSDFAEDTVFLFSWTSIQQQQRLQQQQNFQTHQASQAQSQFSESDMGSSSNRHQYNQYPASRSDSDFYRPTAASIVPIISQGIKGGHQYDLSSQSEFSSHGSSSNMAQLEQQLQSDLSSQLQAALSQNVAHLGRYPSQSRGQAGFEEAYRRLSEELQRNLTQQLQSFVSGSSGYASSIGNVNEHQLAQLRSQLQNSLASQLQQGLQQSYSSSASFSASAGSSAHAGAGAYSSSSGDYYRGTRGN